VQIHGCIGGLADRGARARAALLGSSALSAAVLAMLLADDDSGSAGAFALRDTITISIPGWADA
jgi:hypothetical protein